MIFIIFCWLIRTLIQIPRNQNGWLSSLICCNLFFKISLPVLSTYQDTGLHADDILAHTGNDKIPLYWDICHCKTHTLSIHLYLHQTYICVQPINLRTLNTVTVYELNVRCGSGTTKYFTMSTGICNRSTTDHIFCIRQILEKKWEYNEAVHQLFIDFKKACDSVRREVLYNILVSLVSPWNW